MTAEDLKSLARRQPFNPFTIHMNDGSRLKVTQPDNFFMPPAWKFGAIIAFDDGRFSVIALRNVAHVATRGSWPQLRGRRKKGSGSADNE